MPVIYFKAAAIMFLVVLMAIASYMPYVELNLLRLYILAGVLFFFVGSINAGFKVEIYGRFVLYFFLLWISTGFLLSIGVSDTKAALKELSFIVLGGLIIIFLYCILKTKLIDQILLCHAWLLYFVMTAPIAVWELVTGLHLESSYSLDRPEYTLNRFWAMSTFGNPNNYGAFLVLAFPFLFAGEKLTINRFLKLVFRISFLVLPLFVIFSGSRGALGALFIELVIILGWRYGYIKVCMLFMGFLVSGYFSFVSLKDVFYYSRIPLLTKIFFISDSMEDGGSFHERLALYMNGLFIILKTYGLGSGPGSFATAVIAKDMPFDIHVPNPHNFWIEMASQYGVVVFLYFLAIYYAIMKRFMIFSLSKIDPLTSYYSVTMLSACFGFLLASILNSSYINQPYNWFFLGSLIVSLRFLNSQRLWTK